MARYFGWGLTQAPGSAQGVDVGALVRQRFGRGRRAAHRAAQGGLGATTAARQQGAGYDEEKELWGSQAMECEEDEDVDGEAGEDDIEDPGIDIEHTQGPCGMGVGCYDEEDEYCG